jgi:hypothetical protein
LNTVLHIQEEVFGNQIALFKELSRESFALVEVTVFVEVIQVNG